jgi:hypothetical protein
MQHYGQTQTFKHSHFRAVKVLFLNLSWPAVCVHPFPVSVDTNIIENFFYEPCCQQQSIGCLSMLILYNLLIATLSTG